MRRRGRFVLGCAIITVLFGAALPRLTADHDPRAFHPQGSPLVALTRHAEKVFGADDQTALVAVLDPGLFTRDGIRRLDTLTRALDGLDGVERVLSLTNLPDISGDSDTLDVTPRLTEALSGGDDGALAAARRDLLADELVGGVLLSRDGEATLIQVEVLEAWSAPKKRADLHDRIEALLAESAAPGVEFLLGGFPMVRVEYSRELLGETGRLLGFTALGLVILVGVMLRSVRGALITVGVVLVANVWTHGAMALAGEPLTILSMLTPIIVLIVGVADAVHVLLAFRREPGTREERAIRAAESIGPAGFLTSVTTALGFLTLLTADDVRMLRVFGVTTAVGVLAAWLVTMLLVPPLLASRRVGFDRDRRGDVKAPETPDTRLGARIVARPVRALILAGLVIVVASFVASRISTDAKILDGLRDDHPIMRTYHALEERFGGSLPLQVVYDAPAGDGVADPALLAHMAKTAEWLRSQPGVGQVRSPDAFARRLHAALSGETGLPSTADALSELYLTASFGDRDPFDGLVNTTDGVARIQTLLYERGSTETLALTDRLQAFLDANPLPGATIGLAGTAYIAPRAWARLLDDMVWSSVWAVLLITALFAVLFRSVTLALLTIPPNLVPLVFVLAAMAALGIPVKGNNAVVFSIAYGVAVDDTIYFLAHLRHLWRGGVPWKDAVIRAHAEMTKPLITTTVVLGLGFSVFLLSTFEFSVTLGLQMLVCVLAGAAAELWLMPALLALWAPRGRRP